MALTAGTILLDRYVLRAVLGQGGFGTVWQAVDRVDRKPVAVKVLHPSSTALDRRRFELEARALARLNHPNCLRVHDSGRLDDGTMVIVTELLRGDTLREAALHGLSVDDAIKVARQIAEALDAAHRAGIVHRDLKPANVQVSRDDHGQFQVTVLDFGIAKLVGSDAADITKTGEVIGTTGFMSPEQLCGRSDIGPATDLYALGLLLYLMVEGRPPFLGDTPLAIGMAHVTEPAPPLTRGPAPLCELVAKLLAKAPEDRPPTARFVAAELAQLQGAPLAPQARLASDEIAPATWIGASLVAAVLVGLAIMALEPADEAPAPAVMPVLPARAAARMPIPEPATPAIDLGTPRSFEGSAGCLNRPVPGAKQYDNVPVSLLEVRSVLHHVPRTYDGKTPMPLVVIFHRNKQSAAEALDETEFAAVADEHGFVVAAPQSRRGQGVPWIEGDYLNAEDDIAALSDARCIDTSRIYLVALAEGNRAAAELICAAPERYAAIVSSSGRFSQGWQSCMHRNGGAAIPLLEFTNIEDAEQPLAGGESGAKCAGKGFFWPLDRHQDAHRMLHGCDGEATPFDLAAGRAECKTWSCQTPYVSCLIEGGKFWTERPRNRAVEPCHARVADVPRAALAWQFLSRYPAPLDGLQPAPER